MALVTCAGPGLQKRAAENRVAGRASLVSHCQCFPRRHARAGARRGAGGAAPAACKQGRPAASSGLVQGQVHKIRDKATEFNAQTELAKICGMIRAKFYDHTAKFKNTKTEYKNRHDST